MPLTFVSLAFPYVLYSTYNSFVFREHFLLQIKLSIYILQQAGPFVEVLNVITFFPKCNKVLNVITFCPKCNKLREQHDMEPEDIAQSFRILRKCQNKFDCLIFEMFFIQELKPTLNKQCDSIRAKLFV